MHHIDVVIVAIWNVIAMFQDQTAVSSIKETIKNFATKTPRHKEKIYLSVFVATVGCFIGVNMRIYV